MKNYEIRTEKRILRKEIKVKFRKGNPSTPTTAQEMIAVAQEAAAIFINLPEIEKRQKLREIETVNKTMKELITSMMTETREDQNRQFIAQGQQMAAQGTGM